MFRRVSCQYRIIILVVIALPAHSPDHNLNAGITVFDDKVAFLHESDASSATGVLPDLGKVALPITIGDLRFSLGPSSSRLFVGTANVANPSLAGNDWTTRLPGNEIAITGKENLNVDLSRQTYSFGFEFVEPQIDPNVGSTFIDSTFNVRLLQNGSVSDTFTFNAPNDAAAFVGVVSDSGFDRVEIRETTGGIENEFFGEFFADTAHSTECQRSRNLLQNCSFETIAEIPTGVIDPFSNKPLDLTTPPNEDRQFYVLEHRSNAITDWTVTSDGDAATIDWVYRDHLPSSDGDLSVDLNGSPGVGGISQTIATTPGAQYRVRFDMAANPKLHESSSDPNPVKSLNLSAAGNTSPNFEVDVTDSSSDDLNWKTFQWDFTAREESTSIEFMSATPQYQSPENQILDFGPMLDNAIVFQLGDFDASGVMDDRDIDRLITNLNNDHWEFDLTADGNTNSDDLSFWLHELRNTYFGDANLDGEFNSGDLVAIFEAGKYGQDVDAVWAEGDWNGDLRFDSSDLIAAFQDGGYESGPRVAAKAVPEPTALTWLLLGLVFLFNLHRRRDC